VTEIGKSDVERLAPAWREFEIRSPVKLRAVEIGDDENHALMGLLDVVTFLVRDYEERHVDIPDAKPAAVLRFLMRQHGLRQVDLAPIFGAQSNVSEVLSGKREINARQARALAERFGVSAAVFI